MKEIPFPPSSFTYLTTHVSLFSGEHIPSFGEMCVQRRGGSVVRWAVIPLPPARRLLHHASHFHFPNPPTGLIMMHGILSDSTNPHDFHFSPVWIKSRSKFNFPPCSHVGVETVSRRAPTFDVARAKGEMLNEELFRGKNS